MFSLICAWINGWINNCEAGDFRRHRTHYDATVMGGSEWWRHWTHKRCIYRASFVNTSTKMTVVCIILHPMTHLFLTKNYLTWDWAMEMSYTYLRQPDATHPCRNLNGSFTKTPMNLGYGWVIITTYIKLWMWLFILFPNRSIPSNIFVGIATTSTRVMGCGKVYGY